MRRNPPANPQTISHLAASVFDALVWHAGFSDGASYALSLGQPNADVFSHIIAFSPGFMRAPSLVSGSTMVPCIPVMQLWWAQGTATGRTCHWQLRTRPGRPGPEHRWCQGYCERLLPQRECVGVRSASERVPSVADKCGIGNSMKIALARCTCQGAALTCVIHWSQSSRQGKACVQPVSLWLFAGHATYTGLALGKTHHNNHRCLIASSE